jgi:hypothetical protein
MWVRGAAGGHISKWGELVIMPQVKADWRRFVDVQLG